MTNRESVKFDKLCKQSFESEKQNFNATSLYFLLRGCYCDYKQLLVNSCLLSVRSATEL